MASAERVAPPPWPSLRAKVEWRGEVCVGRERSDCTCPLRSFINMSVQFLSPCCAAASAHRTPHTMHHLFVLSQQAVMSKSSFSLLAKKNKKSKNFARTISFSLHGNGYEA